MLAYNSGVVQFVLIMFHSLEGAHTQGGVLSVVVGVDKFSQHVFNLAVFDLFSSVSPGKITPYLFPGTVKPLYNSSFDIPVVSVELAAPVLPGQLFHMYIKEPSSVCR